MKLCFLISCVLIPSFCIIAIWKAISAILTPCILLAVARQCTPPLLVSSYSGKTRFLLRSGLHLSRAAVSPPLLYAYTPAPGPGRRTRPARAQWHSKTSLATSVCVPSCQLLARRCHFENLNWFKYLLEHNDGVGGGQRFLPLFVTSAICRLTVDSCWPHRDSV